ncbi:MAG: hypothetical protein N3G80_03015 [Candidatus Micrarchaeota archaeon]|nr:hypothetical protein [Candidatus Micrarchaeota archaeon]
MEFKDKATSSRKNEATYFIDNFINSLREKIGKEYGNGPEKYNCVTLILHALKNDVDAKKFVNGGRLLNEVQKVSSIQIFSAEELAKKEIPSGMLLMRLKEANNQELLKFFKAGDYAVWKGKDGGIKFVQTIDEAKEMLKQMNEGKGKLYFCRHYLVTAEKIESSKRQQTVIHASSSKGKVVEQSMESYLASNSNSVFVLVNLQEIYPYIRKSAFFSEKN